MRILKYSVIFPLLWVLNITFAQDDFKLTETYMSENGSFTIMHPENWWIAPDGVGDTVMMGTRFDIATRFRIDTKSLFMEVYGPGYVDAHTDEPTSAQDALSQVLDALPELDKDTIAVPATIDLGDERDTAAIYLDRADRKGRIYMIAFSEGGYGMLIAEIVPDSFTQIDDITEAMVIRLDSGHDSSGIKAPGLGPVNEIAENLTETFVSQFGFQVQYPKGWRIADDLEGFAEAPEMGGAALAANENLDIRMILFEVVAAESSEPDLVTGLRRELGRAIVGTIWLEPDAAGRSTAYADTLIEGSIPGIGFLIDLGDGQLGLVAGYDFSGASEMRPAARATITAIAASYELADESVIPDSVSGAVVPDTANPGVCEVTATNNVNRRTRAGTNFNVAGQLEVGNVAAVTGQTTDSSGFIWWQLEDGSYVREDVVVEQGDCQDVPPAS